MPWNVNNDGVMEWYDAPSTPNPYSGAIPYEQMYPYTDAQGNRGRWDVDADGLQQWQAAPPPPAANQWGKNYWFPSNETSGTGDSWTDTQGYRNAETGQFSQTLPQGANILQKVGNIRAEDYGLWGPAYKAPDGTIYGTTKGATGAAPLKPLTGGQFTPQVVQGLLEGTAEADRQHEAAGPGWFDSFMDRLGPGVALLPLGIAAATGALGAGAAASGAGAGAGAAGIAPEVGALYGGLDAATLAGVDLAGTAGLTGAGAGAVAGADMITGGIPALTTGNPVVANSLATLAGGETGLATTLLPEVAKVAGDVVNTAITTPVTQVGAPTVEKSVNATLKDKILNTTPTIENLTESLTNGYKPVTGTPSLEEVLTKVKSTVGNVPGLDDIVKGLVGGGLGLDSILDMGARLAPGLAAINYAKNQSSPDMSGIDSVRDKLTNFDTNINTDGLTTAANAVKNWKPNIDTTDLKTAQTAINNWTPNIDTTELTSALESMKNFTPTIDTTELMKAWTEAEKALPTVDYKGFDTAITNLETPFKDTDYSGLSAVLAKLGGLDDPLVAAAENPFKEQLAQGQGEIIRSAGLRGLGGSSFVANDLANFTNPLTRNMTDASTKALATSLTTQGTLGDMIAKIQQQDQINKTNQYKSLGDVASQRGQLQLGEGTNQINRSRVLGDIGGHLTTADTNRQKMVLEALGLRGRAAERLTQASADQQRLVLERLGLQTDAAGKITQASSDEQKLILQAMGYEIDAQGKLVDAETNKSRLALDALLGQGTLETNKLTAANQSTATKNALYGRALDMLGQGLSGSTKTNPNSLDSLRQILKDLGIEIPD